ncbi:MAG: M3 family metallopeptidase [Bacteroidaceae bacterium]|nr:M3 family metallopeptidase [Bacteroidaceae bacterium]
MATRINPFFEPYGTPHNTTPFPKIEERDFEPALEEGMRREDSEIEAIINNPEPATFANTVLALEHSGELLSRVETLMGNLLSACTSDRLEALAQKMAPKLSEHSNRIMLNEKLFRRIKAVKDSKPVLGEEEQTLLNKVYEGFKMRGVGLSKKKKLRLMQLSTEASLKALQFSQNVLKDTNRFKLLITNRDELKGMPEHQMELARSAAQESGKEGWLFTLQAPSWGPLLTYCDNRKLRRKVWLAHNTLCIKNNKYNNLQLARDLVNLRMESAQLLGNATFAQQALKQRMAERPAKVMSFLNELLEAYRPTAKREYEELKAYARKLEGNNFRMKPWDTAYYSHKLQLERYNFDAEMLRPYFELSNVIKGVFGLATRLYGITFKENKEIPVYHEDVKAYEVMDKDGSYLAVLYADFHPRSNKKSGAWMTSYQGQWKERSMVNGQQSMVNVRPHVSLTMNLTKPTPDKPALLTLGEVSTFLHEFGHGLHEIFSQCQFESLSGTNVYWDFVELPSQFMENYALEKEFLNTFAFHYETGELIPDELIERVIESRHYHAAMACMRQLSFCLLDMAYYTRTTPLNKDIIEYEREAWRPALVAKPSGLRTCMTTQFQHIMTGGYAAGYYCYKWAEVLDADAFSAFQEEGVFNTETAARFRHEILERGNTQPPKKLYRNFRRRNPSIKAMLRRDGVKN